MAMHLFGALNPDIFMIFSGSSRRLYEEAIVRLYEGCFGAELMFPTRNQMIGLLYDVLAAHPGLWHEEGDLVALDAVTAGPRRRRMQRRQHAAADADATGEAMARARHLYARLVQTGWLEESHYGLRITVDMPAGAMRLADFLCLLRRGVTERLGGLVVEVRNALEAVRANPAENALGLHKAADDTVSFGRFLRSVLSALRGVEREIMRSESLGERLQHYFEDFVERVLLRDYASIATTAHPYRFRRQILDALRQVEESPVDLESIAGAYREAGLGAEGAAPRDLVFDDLDRIRHVFRRIEEAFRHIEQARGRLELRLRSTVRYAGRRAGTFLERSEGLIRRLDVIAARPRLAEPAIPAMLEPERLHFGPALLARPRAPRVAVTPGRIELRPPDPLHALMKRLERDYRRRIAVTPDQVLRFLERRVPPFGSTTARHLPIESLDDFLAFEALRQAVQPTLHRAETDGPLLRRLEPDFAFEADDGLVDNAWLSCRGFRVRRRGDHVTLGAADGD